MATVSGTKTHQNLSPRSVGHVIVEHAHKHGWERAASVGVSDRCRGCCGRCTGWQTTGKVTFELEK